MGKRKRDKDMEKMRKLKKKLLKLERKWASSSDTSSISSSSSSDGEYGDSEIAVLDDNITTAQPVDTEQVADPEALQLLGANPSEMSVEGPTVHEEIIKRWNRFLTKGIEREDRSQLLSKYPIIKNCKALLAPKVNGEILSVLEQNTIKTDAFLSKLQDHLGSSLSALAIPLDKLLVSPTEQTNDLLPQLVDAARLLTDLHHTISVHRRFLIVPNLNPSVKKLVENSSIDTLLFGESFSDRVKTSQDMQKLGNDLRLAKPKYIQRYSGAGTAVGTSRRTLPSNYNNSKNSRRPKSTSRWKQEGRSRLKDAKRPYRHR